MGKILRNAEKNQKHRYIKRILGCVFGVSVAFGLPGVGSSFAADLRMDERRSHVDFAARAEEQAETSDASNARRTYPRVSWIRKTWTKEKDRPVGEAVSAKGEIVRAQEILLIEEGKTRFVYRQETVFSEGVTGSSLKVSWGPEDSELLTARHEFKDTSGLASWLKRVAGGESEEGWVEVTIGGRLFHYPEKSWIDGTIHPEDTSLLNELVDNRLRTSLERVDSMTRAGYIPYHPYLIDLLVFPLLHHGKELEVTEYTNPGNTHNAAVFHTSAPNCPFDATFGEICPDELNAPARTETFGRELALVERDGPR